MPEEREIEKQLKLVSKTGKFVVGRREVMSGLKGSKLLVWSASANLPQDLLNESKNLSIPAVRFNGNPVELGRACGIPFRVSVIAVKAPGDADIKAFSSSSDYVSSASTLTVVQAKPEEAEEEKEENEAPQKPVKTTKRKPTESKEEEAPAKSARKKKASKQEEVEQGEETEAKTKPKKTKKSTKAKEESES